MPKNLSEKLNPAARIFRAGVLGALGGVLLSQALNALPEAPSIDRSVTERQGEPAAYLRPHLPALHTSGDGRVAVDIKPDAGPQRVNFYLFTPEKLTTHFIDANPGAGEVLSTTDYYATDMNEFVSEILEDRDGNETGVIRHVTIIDKTREFVDEEGYVNNPVGESIEGVDYDVYYLTVHATADYQDSGGFDELRHQFTDVRALVGNPKTATAYLADIQFPGHPDFPQGRKQGSAQYTQAPRMFENKFTHDGKLLVGRISHRFHYYHHPVSGELIRSDFADVVYAYSSDGSLDGDPNVPQDGFDNMIPLSMAPYDPRITENYEFAKFPFRDGNGNLVPPGADIGGSYPWIDTDGRTISMSTVRATLNNGSRNPRYPNVPYDPNQAASLDEDGGPFQNQSFVGLWTQGKIISMDNTLNNTDYGLRVMDRHHRIVDLYEPSSGPETSALPITDGKIRVGSGRDNTGFAPPAGVGNTTFFETLENKFNYEPNLRPVMPRDVVWWVSNGKSTAQFAFDDYLNKDSFINSKMNGALELDPRAGASRRFIYHDGWSGSSFSLPVRVANDGTALPERWDIPENGLLVGSGARLEPVAHGGIEGKGVWLDSHMGIQYTIEEQPSSVAESDWYVGVFVDSRVDDAAERSLITFPDGSSINLLGRETLRYRDTGAAIVADITLPDAASLQASDSWDRNQWRHLAFQVLGGGTAVDFYHNGFLAASTDLSERMFQMNTGTLSLGKRTGSSKDGYRGWFDDFKVFAQAFDPEVCANLARGTLVGFPASHALAARAELYAGSSGRILIDDLLYHSGQKRHERYAVFYDYTQDNGAHLGNIPSGAESVREGIIFPEASLFSDARRPDSIANSFCFSCHDDSNPSIGLRLEALSLNSALLGRDDGRRQPLQALRRVFGHIPAGWIEETGLPLSYTTTGGEGILIDDYILSPQIAEQREVVTFSLIDTGTNSVIRRLSSNDVVDFAEIDPEPLGLSIRANLDAAQGSVVFQMKKAGTDLEVFSNTVDEAPYALFGSSVSGSMVTVYAGDIGNGAFDIKATPFRDSGGASVEGKSLELVNVYFVNMGSSDYFSWIEGFALSGADALMTANPDKGSLNNLLEYAFGGDPTDSSDDDLVSLNCILRSDSGNQYLEISYRKRKAATNLAYTIYVADELASGEWLVLGEAESSVSLDDQFDLVTTRIAISPEGFKRFVRLSVTHN